MKIGNTVVPCKGCPPLRSGCEAYPYAVVGSLRPFVLVSPEGTMLWATTYTPEMVRRKGRATPEEIACTRRRMSREYRAGRYLPCGAEIVEYAWRRGMPGASLAYLGGGVFMLRGATDGGRLVAIARECGIYVAAGDEPFSVKVEPANFCQPALEHLPALGEAAVCPGAWVRPTTEWLDKGAPAEQARFSNRVGVVASVAPSGMVEVRFATTAQLKEARLVIAVRRLEVVLLP